MRQRIAAGSFGVAAILVLIGLWSINVGKHASAMERMAEEIRRAKSYKVTTVFEVKLVRQAGKPAIKSELTGTFYWLATGSVRMENKGDESWAGKDDVEIYPAGKAGISIDRKEKKFRRTPARQGQFPRLMMLDQLSQYAGQAKRNLGTKEIEGTRVQGFEIEITKIDPDVKSGQAEIWIDTRTNLPVLLRYAMMTDGVPATLIMQDFQWNIELDPKLFDPTPPEGYADATPKPPSLEQQMADISHALKIYAELSGGHYPQVKMVYGDVTRDEMYKMAGIADRPTPDQIGTEKYANIVRAMTGFTRLNGILRDNPDAAYYGKTVGPKDSGQVLLRWRLDDGRYQVVFGDLRAEIVTADRLRTLEAK